MKLLEILQEIPEKRSVILLLRHAERPPLPGDQSDFPLPVTENGRKTALALGEALGTGLSSLYTSPFARCVQTAEAMREGAKRSLEIHSNRYLGDPGVYVLHGPTAQENWKEMGDDGVFEHLLTQDHALPGMAAPPLAAHFLLRHMLGVTEEKPGLHVFVTHDNVLLPTFAQVMNLSPGLDERPEFLEAAIFYVEEDELRGRYRDHETTRPLSEICPPGKSQFLDYARREVAATVGLDCPARFFFAGGGYKTVIHGRPTRDLDFWATSDEDRKLLIKCILERGGTLEENRPPFADHYKLKDILIDVPEKTEPHTLRQRLGRFDICISAVGVEFAPEKDYNEIILDPTVIPSIQNQEILLIKELRNPRHILHTLHRMLRYKKELGWALPQSEVDEVWRAFDGPQPHFKETSSLDKMQEGMIERLRKSVPDDYHNIEEQARRRMKGYNADGEAPQEEERNTPSLTPPKNSPGEPEHDSLPPNQDPETNMTIDLNNNKKYDVFLSHNSKDKPAVEIIAKKLKEQYKLKVFLDKWDLIPGDPWQEELEQALHDSRACAVFLGAESMGRWHNEEMRTALDKRTNKEIRVVPVILPGDFQEVDIPLFLSRLTWVEFLNLEDKEPLERLYSGILGRKRDADGG